MPQFKSPRILLILGLVLCTAAPAQQSVSTNLAPPDPAVQRSLPKYLAGRAARFAGWLEDGSLLITTRFGETEQVHRVRGPLAAREQQTFDPEGVLEAAARPRHDGAVAYLTLQTDGSTVLRLQSTPAMAPEPLTDGRSRISSPRWSHDGQRLAFVSAGSGRDAAVEVLEIGASDAAAAPGTPAVPRLIAGGADYRWHLLDWSPDDQRLLLGRETVTGDASTVPGASAREMDLFTADVTSGALTPIALTRAEPGPGKATGRGRGKGRHRHEAEPTVLPLRASRARFAPDGRGLLLLRRRDDAGAEFEQLQQLDPGASDPRTLSVESGRDVELFDVSPDGRFLAYTSNDGGLSRLTLIDQQRRLDLNPSAVPAGVISSLAFDASGKRLALTVTTAREPSDIYVLEPETQQLSRWTQSELGPLDPGALVTPTLVRFPTWDRVEDQPRVLTAYLWHPTSTPSAAAPHPVLILLRSGGGSQYRPEYDPLIQFLVRELGFVVLAPNVRGSAGFGGSFAALARGELRDDAARDVGSLLVWVGLQHELDFNHIAVMGEGYGAYLALASLAQYGDRLVGGIAAFPPHLGSVTNLVSIRRPVLFVQGRSDPDAPAYELEQLAARIRLHEADVQYLGAADEGARFERRSNREAYAAAVANFLVQLTH